MNPWKNNVKVGDVIEYCGPRVKIWPQHGGGPTHLETSDKFIVYNIVPGEAGDDTLYMMNSNIKFSVGYSWDKFTFLRILNNE
jgi:hypothetical protein